MKCVIFAFLLFASVSAYNHRFRRQLPPLPGVGSLVPAGGISPGAICTPNDRALCGNIVCQNNNNQNTQVLGGGNSGGGPALLGVVPANVLNSAGVQAPINVNLCPSVQICNVCLAASVGSGLGG
ncbi:uncharacterized protein LOC129593334 [Paramacrobiotus metropolitanus]|uniref:uncharacterized protein LOC129593334 n=1 Tax=Paramacrobiotus metropolitanus TaxID=2943436 RepID=UPI0024457B35|nr:uncharacterized protein LOC129593334 [Paramacrobiotus metropolitanus]